jgi:hypothetical protein
VILSDMTSRVAEERKPGIPPTLITDHTEYINIRETVRKLTIYRDPTQVRALPQPSHIAQRTSYLSLYHYFVIFVSALKSATSQSAFYIPYQHIPSETKQIRRGMVEIMVTVTNGCRHRGYRCRTLNLTARFIAAGVREQVVNANTEQSLCYAMGRHRGKPVASTNPKYKSNTNKCQGRNQQTL